MKKIHNCYWCFILLSLFWQSQAFATEPVDMSGPGWVMQTAAPVSPEEAGAYYTSIQGQTPAITKFSEAAVGPMSATAQLGEAAVGPMSATTASSEINELARALLHNKTLIYEYVLNNIDYVPYFGSLKGATLTYLDGSGNDFDQASLLISLLRASNITAQYVYGTMSIPVDYMTNWLGVPVYTGVVDDILSNGGIPHTIYTDGVVMNRVWVKVTIDGQDEYFDPTFKTYSDFAKIDLTAALGYNQADFLAGATTGATVGGDYVQNINEGNIKTKVATYAANLTNTIQNQHPNKTVEEIIGGRSIPRYTLTTAQSSSLTQSFYPTVTEIWDEIPASYSTTIRIQHAGIDITGNTADLSGKRLTLTYAGTDHHPELRYDGNLLVSGTATSPESMNDCTVTVNHPYADNGGKFLDDDDNRPSPVYKLKSGKSYAIVYNFGGVADTLLPKLQQQLDSYKAQELADPTEAVLGQTLHVMGMTYLKEVAQSSKLLDAIAETVNVTHHHVGLMAQEAGYYIDLKNWVLTNTSRHDIAGVGSAHFKIGTLIASAFEHGMLEQLTGSDKPGVSTMKLFQIANATGRKVFLTDSVNFATVKPQLANYTASELTDFQNQIDSGRVLILPDNAPWTSGSGRGRDTSLNRSIAAIRPLGL